MYSLQIPGEIDAAEITSFQGDPDSRDFVVTLADSQWSTYFFKHATDGLAIDAVIVAIGATWTLKNVYVASLQLGGNAGEDNPPIILTLNAETATANYDQ